MELMSIANAIVIFGFGVLAAYFFIAAYRVLKSDPSEYRRNRLRSKNLATVLRGDLRGDSEGQRDSVVQAGLAIDKNNQWKGQGRISEDSILNVLRKS